MLLFYAHVLKRTPPPTFVLFYKSNIRIVALVLEAYATVSYLFSCNRRVSTGHVRDRGGGRAPVGGAGVPRGEAHSVPLQAARVHQVEGKLTTANGGGEASEADVGEHREGGVDKYFNHSSYTFVARSTSCIIVHYYITLLTFCGYILQSLFFTRTVLCTCILCWSVCYRTEPIGCSGCCLRGGYQRQPGIIFCSWW